MHGDKIHVPELRSRPPLEPPVVRKVQPTFNAPIEIRSVKTAFPGYQPPPREKTPEIESDVVSYHVPSTYKQDFNKIVKPKPFVQKELEV